VFCVETNGYPQSVPFALEAAPAPLVARAAGYGMPGERVDGMDVEAVHEAARRAVERARAGEGPSLLEGLCYRYGPNTSNDDDSRYRSREEVAEWRSRDPLPRVRERLPSAVADALDEAARRTAEEAAEWAAAQPDGDPATVLDHVYAGDARAG
jgi:pyruvate dehydrogenase E1 component alpha subunit